MDSDTQLVRTLVGKEKCVEGLSVEGRFGAGNAHRQMSADLSEENVSK